MSLCPDLAHFICTAAFEKYHVNNHVTLLNSPLCQPATPLSTQRHESEILDNPFDLRVIMKATLWSQWSLPKRTRILATVLSSVRHRKLGGQHSEHYIMGSRWSRGGLGADRDRSYAH
jgi:hypothetical protein